MPQPLGRFRSIMTVLILLIGICESLIPKKVWAYAPVAKEMTVLQQLCVSNIQRYSQSSGYNFSFITNDNYTAFFEDWHEIASILDVSQIDRSVNIAALIQLKILEKYGGVWIDSSMMLVQNLDWLDTIKNQKFINNRIDNPDVVMFYEPSFFDQTEKRIKLKEEKLVIIPHYQTWFMAAVQDSLFIKTLKSQYILTAMASYQNTINTISDKGIEVEDYLIDERKFLPWVMKVVVAAQQQELDKQKKSQRQLAINYFRISAVDLTKSVKIVNTEAHGYVHLTTKYLAQLNMHELDLSLNFAVRFDEEVSGELLQTLEVDYVNLEHFHAAADLFCDEGAIPLRYIVKGSILDKYLIQDSQTEIVTYDEEYIRHHCQASFVEVYLLFFTSYLLPVLALVLNVYITRKAILVFKPQWGVRRRRVRNQLQESDI